MLRDTEVSTPDKTGVLILIDQFTKDTVNNIAYEMIAKKATIIVDIREIDISFRGYKLIVFEPALCVVLTKEIIEQLEDEFDLHVICLYQDENVKDVLGPSVKMIKCSYSDIDWNLIYGLVQSDKAILEPYLSSIDVLNSFNAVRMRLPADTVDYIDRFRGTYLQLVANVRELLQENRELKETVETQEAIGKRSIAGIKELKQLTDNISDRMRSYEALLSAGCDITLSGFYPDRPNVLYIKSISHVSGIDLFINILFTVITAQYKLGCKVLKLVDESNARVLKYTPNAYVPLTDTYNTAQVLENEFIVKLGSFKLTLDLLMLNKSGLDVLIVHDCRSILQDAIDSPLVTLKINEVSSDFAALGEYDNVLSDLGRQVTFPWDYQTCKKYLGSGVTKLVNHPTIVKVLDLLL